MDEGSLSGPLHVAGTSVEQGRYLAVAADCVACHSVAGRADYAGGLAFRLPFGILYSSNLTPDLDAGIGAWSDDEFLRAVRSGVGRGGRHLYPAHPYATYAAMARNDVLAIRAYLASLPPDPNKVPASQLRFPFSQRGLLPLWNALFLSAQHFQPDASHDDAWNRGSYLATALGHCGECHTPRNVAYALQSRRALTGALTRGWKAYDITAGASGIGLWTETALDEYLASGHATGHGVASGPMKEVVVRSTSQLTAEDRKALIAYLINGRPASGSSLSSEVATVAPAIPPSGGLGAALFAGTCSGCHSVDPKATLGGYADFEGARTVRDPQGTNLLKLLSDGSSHGVDGTMGMPGFGREYSDTERAALANYVLLRWGHLRPSLTPNDAGRAAVAD